MKYTCCESREISNAARAGINPIFPRALQGGKGIVDVAVFGSGLHVTVVEERGIEDIRTVLGAAGIRIDSLEPIPPSMEDVFVGLIEEQERAVAK